MKRRFNYTNRRALESKHIAIKLLGAKLPGEAQSFSINLDIPEEWRLDPNAKIYVEAYVKSSSMRFDFGTVASLAAPSDTSLTEVDTGEPVLFRVKIVDESGEVGLLLASADEVRPREDNDDGEGLRAFFPLVLTNLGEEVWRVSISHAERPVLQINNQIPGLREDLLQNPLLQGAILPAAMRVVLEAILISGEYDEAKWIDEWKAFTQQMGAEPWPDEDEDDAEADDSKIRAIDSAMQRFTTLKQFATKAKDKITGELRD